SGTLSSVTTTKENAFVSDSKQMLVTIDNQGGAVDTTGWMIIAYSGETLSGVSSYVGDGAASNEAYINLNNLFGADGINWTPVGLRNITIEVRRGIGAGTIYKTFPLDFSNNFSVSALYAVTANEQAASYVLTVSLDGTGNGTVVSNPVGIDCGIDCFETYARGTEVTLTSTPDESSIFTGWFGICSGVTPACTFTMDADKTVGATFTKKTYAVSSMAGSGGTITPSGTTVVNHGADQTFTITPDINYHVSDLVVDGLSAGAVSSYTFTNITAGHTINVSFKKRPYSLSKFPIAITSGSEFSISAAFDGTNYLVAIQGDAAGQNNITAQFISRAGKLLGPGVSTGRTGWAPQVAFDGTNYLLIWTGDATSPDTDIYGQFITKNRALMGSPFLISQTSGIQKTTLHSIAFDGVNYFVVWDDFRSGDSYVYGQFVSPSGNLAGPEIQISAGPGQMSSVESDGNNYMVVWDAGTDIRGRNINKDGSLAGSEFIIDTKQQIVSDYNFINLAFDGTNYFVVWNDWNDRVGNAPSAWDLFGRIVDISGNPVSSVINVSSAQGDQTLPFIGFDGSNYLVTWTDGRKDANSNRICESGEGSCLDIYGQFIDKEGNRVNSEFTFGEYADNQLGAFVIFDGARYFAIGNSGISFDLQTGKIIGGNVYGGFLPGIGEQTWFEETDPSIAYSGVWNEYLCIPCSNKGVKASWGIGAKTEFSFTGTGVRWIGTKGTKNGKAKIYIDGVYTGVTADQYSPAPKYQQIIYQKMGLLPGNHTITIEVSGLKNSSAAGHTINIDAFEIVP
ncbi:MAG: hypothetical protein PH343_07720, partial [Nitrospira sp.]|nr:hypothetical protein [Nitrospira sp.]